MSDSQILCLTCLTWRVVSEEVPAETEIQEVVVGKGELYLTPHCRHQNDFCITMGSDEKHLNDSLTVRPKVSRQGPQTRIFEEKGELKAGIRTEVVSLKVTKI